LTWIPPVIFCVFNITKHYICCGCFKRRSNHANKRSLEASNSTRRGGEGETYVIPTWCLLAKELNVVKFKGTARNQGTCNFFVWKQKKEKEEENDVLPF